MNRLCIEDVLLNNVKKLSTSSRQEVRMVPRGNSAFPSVAALKETVNIIKAIVFPDFFDTRRNNEKIRSYYLGVNIERLYSILNTETRRALRFDNTLSEQEVTEEAVSITLKFIDCLPEIKRLLYTDVEAMYDNDPAAENYAEIILSYPVIYAMVNYRVAHALQTLGTPVIPRIITELAHSQTGIDINPGAKIGEYFAIDHGTGVVIGETSVIGNHVTIYQGVTLGAKNFSLDSEGRPVNMPRHPIIEDNVTIYSNSSILGRITVGHDSIIGGNIWLTHSVPPGSRIVQQRAENSYFTDGLGI